VDLGTASRLPVSLAPRLSASAPTASTSGAAIGQENTHQQNALTTSPLNAWADRSTYDQRVPLFKDGSRPPGASNQQDGDWEELRVRFSLSVIGAPGLALSCAGAACRILIEWVKGRTAAALERERNNATAELIRLMPPGTELLEYEPGGRLRIIRMPGPAAARPALAGERLPGPDGELEQ